MQKGSSESQSDVLYLTHSLSYSNSEAGIAINIFKMGQNSLEV